MYLYVYVFLLMGLIGLYTQLHLVQVGRMAERQKALAEIMFTWHDGAFAFVKDKTLSSCVVSKDPDNTPASGTPCVPLMTSHTESGITKPFNSVAYTSGESYLITYVIDHATTGYARYGFRSSEIFQQMKNTDLTPTAYGSVSATSCPGLSGQGFFTEGRIDGVVVCYPVSATIPVGAVGFISPL
ncbi:MAG TPA: hypothetical protein DD400_01365 [Rhodospirillaceae bacterium]|nr:hypothetical protein [Rhodospirillaceae bacterium]